MIEPCSYWVNGFVKLRRGAPGVDRLVDQMTRIQSILAGGGHDDWADCAADVFHPLVYMPLRKSHGNADDSPTISPYDDVLKPSILDIYNAYHRREEESTYTPI